MVYTCKAKKIRVYLNTKPYKTMEQIKAETGCNVILNGQMYNMASVTPCQTMRVDGKTLAYEDKYLGYGWNAEDTALTLTREYDKFDNFLSCVPLINNGEPLKLEYGVDYPAALGGVRGRTAIGMLPDGRIAIFCSKDGTEGRSMETIQEEMMKLGCVTALNLDGGGSSSCITPEGKVTTSRTIYNYICIWTDEPDTEEEKPMFKIALGAGHGITTAGKRCDKTLDPKQTSEWWLNDRVCDYIESYLKDYEGYELLRLDDSDDGKDDIALATRVNAANKWKADFYLSVHHNAGANRTSAGGICAFTYYNSSKAAVEWRDELYEALIEHTGLRGNRAEPKLTAGFYVLKYTAMPAVLLELGFMDSTIDVPIILSDEFAQECAKAIVEVIVKRGKLTKKEKPVTELWKVQLGAFSKKDSADALAKELTAKGYTAYVTKA